jgi:Txe/YoeB family toxin of Txe-Axe toxin-antitoxin module
MTAKIFFADERVKTSYDELKKGYPDERELARFLDRAFDDIAKNPTCGIQIPRKLIPGKYRTKQNITNLWKYNLPNAWRLLYTLKGDRIEILAIVLEWLDHKTYERRFGYG